MPDPRMSQGDPQSLAEVLQRLEPGRRPGRAEPSEARQQVRKNFADIAAARLRGVTWPAIATAMDGLGIRAADGSPLNWRALKTMFYAERDSQIGKPKRRPARKAAAPGDPRTPAKKGELPPAVETLAEPPPPAPPLPDDDRDETERAAKLRAAMARTVRKPFPAAAGFEVPTDPNWRKGE